MKKAEFAFGKHGIRFVLPEGFHYETVESHTASALTDPNQALNYAVDHPVAGPPLSVLAQGKRTAAIAVCDITRPAPNSQTLPPLLRRLHSSGIPLDGVTILIATGLHHGATRDEVKSIVGPEIASSYRVVNHDARSIADHRYLAARARVRRSVSTNAFFLPISTSRLALLSSTSCLVSLEGESSLPRVLPGRRPLRRFTRQSLCASPWPPKVPLKRILSITNSWRWPPWPAMTLCSMSPSLKTARSPVSSPVLLFKPMPPASISSGGPLLVSCPNSPMPLSRVRPVILST